MYEKTLPAVSGSTAAAAGTLPFTGISLVALLAVAAALLVTGTLIYLGVGASRA